MRTITVQVSMSIREAGEDAPPVRDMQTMGGVDYKPIRSGPVQGKYEIFATKNLMGWELMADNGRRVRFDITPLFKEASKQIWNIAKDTQHIGLGVEAAHLIGNALKKNGG